MGDNGGLIASAPCLDALNLHLKSEMLKTNLVVDTKCSSNFELFANVFPPIKPSHIEENEFCVWPFIVIMVGTRHEKRQGSQGKVQLVEL